MVKFLIVFEWNKIFFFCVVVELVVRLFFLQLEKRWEKSVTFLSNTLNLAKLQQVLKN